MPAIVAWIIAGIARIFASRLGQWVTAALVFLGLELAANEVVLQPLLAQIMTVSSGLVGEAAGWLAFFNLDRYITIIVSAYAVAAGKGVIMRRRGAA